MGRIQLLQEDSASAILSTIWEPVRFPHIWRTFYDIRAFRLLQSAFSPHMENIYFIGFICLTYENLSPTGWGKLST